MPRASRGRRCATVGDRGGRVVLQWSWTRPTALLWGSMQRAAIVFLLPLDCSPTTDDGADPADNCQRGRVDESSPLSPAARSRSGGWLVGWTREAGNRATIPLSAA